MRDLAAVIEEAGTVNPTTGGILGKVRPLKAYKELLTDEAFAKNPFARLQFFHQRHSSWDQRLNLYPVLRVDEAPRRESSAGAAP